MHVITGADGFIGSTLTEKLVSKGERVRALAQYNSFGTAGWLDTLEPCIRNEIEVVFGDVRDPECMKAFTNKATHIYHLAALIGVPYSFSCPRSYLETNVNGTLNVLLAARELGCLESVVVTSTSETYGSAQSVPISESHRAYAQSPYAASKIAADQFAVSFFNTYQLPVKVLRPFNTYGPRQSLRAIIPTVISQLLAGCESLSLGDTTTSRDFTYVADTAEAFIQASLSPKINGMQLNVSSGYETTIHQVVLDLCDIVGHHPEIKQDVNRLRPGTSEVKRLIGDSNTFRSITGWKPRYSDESGFHEGLRQTVGWMRESRDWRNLRIMYNV